jgi:hypothetical protein
MGAISIMSSDSQAMGRVGEVIIRTWQTAHKMKVQKGLLPSPDNQHETHDNFGPSDMLLNTQLIRRSLMEFPIMWVQLKQVS